MKVEILSMLHNMDCLCDILDKKIEMSNKGIIATKTSVRMGLENFLLFLILSSGNMDNPQARLFKFYFDDSIAPLFSPQLLMEYIEENHINSDEFMMKVPVGMRLLVEADKVLSANTGRKTKYACKELLGLYL